MLCRILPYQVATGAEQMALDEALLESVSERPEEAVFRTYGWSEPTLSLGYFQSLGEVSSDPRWQGAAIVRRATGGGAIWHDRELTYALILPRSHPVGGRTETLYHAVHGAISAVLEQLGASSRRRGEGRGEAARPFLCFADRDPEDLVVDAIKVVGSAQRRRPRAVLQHGSVLLAASPRVPELPGLAELCGIQVDPAELGRTIATSITSALGLTPREDAVRPVEAERAKALAADVYGHPVWTGKR